MMKSRLLHLVIAVVAAIAVGVWLLTPPTSARGLPACKPEPRVIPPGFKAYGKSYSEWAARWWQWAWSIPKPVNPMLDLDGDDAEEGQIGDVWFLAGYLGEAPSLPVERTCEIPAGKALFFPIINLAWLTFPEDMGGSDPEHYPGDPFKWFIENEWEGFADMGIRPLLNYFMDTATELWCEIDGEPVRNIKRFREDSAVTSIWLPEDDAYLWDEWYPDRSEGIYGPTADAGYYLMVAPLAPGEHTIEFHGKMWSEQHVIYHLTVVE